MFEHLVFLHPAEIKVALVPRFVVSEFIIWRQEGMRFAVSFDLGDLDEGLPFHARLSIRLGQRVTGQGFHIKEDAIAEITVVWNRQDRAPGLLFIGGKDLPQVFRVLAIKRGHRNDGIDPAGSVTEDHHAVEVVTTGMGGPLVALKGRKCARGVVLITQRRVLFRLKTADYQPGY